MVKHWQKTSISFLLKQIREGRKKQEVGDDLVVCAMNLLPVVTTLPSLVVKRYNFFKLSSDHMLITWFTCQVTLRVAACHSKSRPCLV